jgi:hypothetical protein
MALTQIKSTIAAPQAVGWVKLANASTTGSPSEIDFDSGIDSTYTLYAFHVSTWKPTDDDQALYMLFEYGDAWGTASYEYHTQYTETSGTGNGGVAGTSATKLNVLPVGCGNNTAESESCIVYLDNPSGGTYVKACWWAGMGINTSGKPVPMQGAGSNTAATGAITGVRFYPESGTIAAANITMYGLQK